MAAFTTRIDPAIAGYNPMAQFNENQKASADVANTEATTAHTQAQVPLIQQQTRAADLANQQAARDLRDQQIASDAWKESGGDPTKLVQAMTSKGGSPKLVIGTMQSLTQMQRDRAIASKDSNDVFAQQHARLGGLLEEVQAAPADQRPAAWADARESAIKEGLAKPEDYPTQTPDDNWLTMHINGTRVIGGIAAAVAKKQEIDEKVAQAAKATADAARANADAAKTKLETDLMRGMGASAIDDAADKLAPPDQFLDANNAMKTQGRLAMASGKTENVSAAIDRVYQTMVVPQLASTIAGKVREQAAMLPGEVKKASAVASATAPVEVSKAVAVERVKASMAAGTGQIIDPAQRGQVDRTLEAADKEATDKIAEAMRLKGSVALAQSGNKVAPNLETIEVLRSIVNRVNSNELKQVGASGNAIDWLKSVGGKWTAGQPIPENIQKDFASIADAQLKLAQVKHATVYGTVAQKYGLKDLKPPDIAAIYSQASGGSAAGASTANRPPLSSFEKK